MPRLKTGPRGGKFYVNSFGSKVYLKNSRFGSIDKYTPEEQMRFDQKKGYINEKFPSPIDTGKKEYYKKLFGEEIGTEFINIVNELYNKFMYDNIVSTAVTTSGSIMDNFKIFEIKVKNLEKVYSQKLKEPIKNPIQKTIMFILLNFGQQEYKKIVMDNNDKFGFLKVQLNMGEDNDDKLLKKVIKNSIGLVELANYFTIINSAIEINNINIGKLKTTETRQRRNTAFLDGIEKMSKTNYGSYYHW